MGKTFCCFVDFSKAFDTVWRAGLWQKLLDNCIEGKCFRIIRNMGLSIMTDAMFSCIDCLL